MSYLIYSQISMTPRGGASGRGGRGAEGGGDEGKGGSVGPRSCQRPVSQAQRRLRWARTIGRQDGGGHGYGHGWEWLRGQGWERLFLKINLSASL